MIDTSALLAILQVEPEAERFAALIEAAETRLISSASLLEAAIIVPACR